MVCSGRFDIYCLGGRRALLDRVHYNRLKIDEVAEDGERTEDVNDRAGNISARRTTQIR